MTVRKEYDCVKWGQMPGCAARIKQHTVMSSLSAMRLLRSFQIFHLNKKIETRKGAKESQKLDGSHRHHLSLAAGLCQRSAPTQMDHKSSHWSRSDNLF